MPTIVASRELAYPPSRCVDFETAFPRLSGNLTARWANVPNVSSFSGMLSTYDTDDVAGDRITILDIFRHAAANMAVGADNCLASVHYH